MPKRTWVSSSGVRCNDIAVEGGRCHRHDILLQRDRRDRTNNLLKRQGNRHGQQISREERNFAATAADIVDQAGWLPFQNPVVNSAISHDYSAR
jgi:hypothetical protein